MIGKNIASLLEANEDLLELVSADNIYPYVANEDTPLPTIIYGINTLDPEYTKDGWHDDTIGFSVTSYSEDYAMLQDIIKQVRLALELKYVVDKTKRIILKGMLEGFNIAENVFMNRLMFEVTVYDYE
jgi:hypothetical protein